MLNIWPAPVSSRHLALAEQAAARSRSSGAPRPLKWSDWDEAFASLENDDLKVFLREELELGRESYLRRRGLHYRLSGSSVESIDVDDVEEI